MIRNLPPNYTFIATRHIEHIVRTQIQTCLLFINYSRQEIIGIHFISIAGKIDL